MVGGVLQHCAWSQFMTQWVKKSSSEPNPLEDVKFSFYIHTISIIISASFLTPAQDTFHMTSCVQFICLRVVLVKAIEVTEFLLKKKIKKKRKNFTATGSTSACNPSN